MIPAAFIDATVPIYAVGGDHPHRKSCVRLLRMGAEEPQSLLTDSQILQEPMHFYLASGRHEMGLEVPKAFAEALHCRIESVHAVDVILAAELADRLPDISSRDRVHVAVMQRLRTCHVISADTDFDRLEMVERLDPYRVMEWEHLIHGR